MAGPEQSAAPAGPSVSQVAERILIVEDDESIATNLARALTANGYVATRSATGADALTLALDSDLVLLDLGLPDIDGLEVARRLRSRQGHRRLGLVALTGFGGPDDQRRAIDAGFDVHLTKPVTHERLKRVIGDLK